MESLITIDIDVTMLKIDERLQAVNHQMEELSKKIEAREQVEARSLSTCPAKAIGAM